MRHCGTKEIRTLRLTLRRFVPEDAPAMFRNWASAQGEEPIGCISVVHTDDAISAVEIGYCLGRAWWCKGIVSEALSAVMDFFFVETDVQRVCARHDPANPHSGQVMRKCGMTYEGTLRRADREIRSGSGGLLGTEHACGI